MEQTWSDFLFTEVVLNGHWRETGNNIRCKFKKYKASLFQ